MTLLKTSHVSFAVAVALILAAAPARAADFETSALPIFRAKCLMCHSGSAPQASLDLETAPSALRPGHSAWRSHAQPPA
jgi:cytochrome c5